MKYLLLTYLDEKAWHSMTEDQQKDCMSEVAPHIDQLIANKKFIEGAPLYPTTEAATVRPNNGKTVVTDGPFAEAREQVGGYTLIEAHDREEAIAIAAGFMGTKGVATIEVRRVAEPKLISMTKH
jgi:hypothetical protein